MIKIFSKCPACEFDNIIKNKQIGKIIKCTKCNNEFIASKYKEKNVKQNIKLDKELKLGKIKAKCIFCNKEYILDNSLLGKIGKCNNCNKNFTINDISKELTGLEILLKVIFISISILLIFVGGFFAVCGGLFSHTVIQNLLYLWPLFILLIFGIFYRNNLLFLSLGIFIIIILFSSGIINSFTEFLKYL